ncbi:MAG: hypothetical protein ACLQDV_05980 [Candidatus Binataceae bacterium]
MRKVTLLLVAFCIANVGTVLAQGVVLPLPPGDLQRINSMLGPGVVGSPVPSKPIVDATAYFPLQQKTLTYQVTSGKNAGNTQALSVGRRSRPNGQQAWRFQFSPTLAGFLNQSVDGALIMPAVSDSGEGVVVVSTPANPFVPKGMNPGETRSFSQNISVNYLDNPSDQRYSGTVAGTYTYLGTYQVTVPAGTFNADLIRVKFEGNVGPAHTKDTQYNFFAPGVGLVAMITQEDVEAFWIFNIDSSTGKVLAAP